MKLLLHGCCADCTLKYGADKEKDVEVSVYYYNPNIHPRSEYAARLKAMQMICGENGIKLIISDWSPKEWFGVQGTTKTKPLATKPLGAAHLPPLDRGHSKKTRCVRCWELRLRRTAEYAKANNYDAFTSTLLSSKYQDNEAIKKIGEKIGKELGVKFFVPEHVCQDLETKGFYKQFFCGCVYSMMERYEEKYGENSFTKL